MKSPKFEKAVSIQELHEEILAGTSLVYGGDYLGISAEKETCIVHLDDSVSVEDEDLIVGIVAAHIPNTTPKISKFEELFSRVADLEQDVSELK